MENNKDRDYYEHLMEILHIYKKLDLYETADMYFIINEIRKDHEMANKYKEENKNKDKYELCKSLNFSLENLEKLKKYLKDEL